MGQKKGTQNMAVVLVVSLKPTCKGYPQKNNTSVHGDPSQAHTPGTLRLLEHPPQHASDASESSKLPAKTRPRETAPLHFVTRGCCPIWRESLTCCFAAKCDNANTLQVKYGPFSTFHKLLFAESWPNAHSMQKVGCLLLAFSCPQCYQIRSSDGRHNCLLVRRKRETPMDKGFKQGSASDLSPVLCSPCYALAELLSALFKGKFGHQLGSLPAAHSLASSPASAAALCAGTPCLRKIGGWQTRTGPSSSAPPLGELTNLTTVTFLGVPWQGMPRGRPSFGVLEGC